MNEVEAMTVVISLDAGWQDVPLRPETVEAWVLTLAGATDLLGDPLRWEPRGRTK